MWYYAIAALCLLAACSQQTPPQDQSTAAPDEIISLTPEQARTAGIVLDSPRVGTLPRVITLRGTIELPPQSRVRISTVVGCKVRSIAVLPGDRVRKGMPLCVLEGIPIIELQEQFLATRVLAEQALHEYQRQQALAASDATSQRALQEAHALMRQRRIALSASAERLRLLGLDPTRMSDTAITGSVVVRSPLDGYVAAITTTVGQALGPEQQIMELVDIRDVHVVLRAFESELPFIRAGQRLLVRTANSTNAYPAEVVTVGHVLDSSHSTEVHCHFDRYDQQNIRPGMYVNAELTAESTSGYRLPASAVIQWGDEHYIFVPDGNRYRLLAVTVHAQHADSVIVLPRPGTTLPSRVVTKGAYWLLMKLKNTAQEE